MTKPFYLLSYFMQYNEITTGADARTKIFAGIEKVAETVGLTMWPKALNIIIENEYWQPISTNDGVTVVRNIRLKDKYENIGASIVKQAAEKTNKEAGDGTSTSSVLLYSIVKNGLKYIKSGVNPFEIVKGLHKSKSRIIEELQKVATQVTTSEEIYKIAKLSAQDDEVWSLIAEIVTEIGYDGIISVEESRTSGLTKEIVTGMSFDEGYESPYFVTDQQKMEAIVNEPYILVTNHEISAVKDIVHIFDQIAKSGKKDVIIVADRMSGDALEALVLNKMKWLLNIVTVRAAGTGDEKEKFLTDLAIMTGAVFINKQVGMELGSVTLTDLGTANKVIATKDKCTIIGWGGSSESITSHIELLKSQKENAKHDTLKNKITGRIARMSGGIAVIKVGAATEIEMRNRKFKIEDAIAATRSAIEEGYVDGWGTMLVKLSENLSDTLSDKILREALKYPFMRIIENAWYDYEYVLKLVKEAENDLCIFNAKIGIVELSWNIIDPVKVLRLSLENSVSAAAMVLTTGGIIVNVDEEI